METQVKPATKKKNGKNQVEKAKSEPDSAEPYEDGYRYGINRLNWGEPAYELENYHGWTPTQRRKF